MIMKKLRSLACAFVGLSTYGLGDGRSGAVRNGYSITFTGGGND